MQLFLSFLSHSGCVYVDVCECIFCGPFPSMRFNHFGFAFMRFSFSVRAANKNRDQLVGTERKTTTEKNTHTQIRISNEVWPMWTSHHFKIKERSKMLWINLHETIKLCREVYWTVFCLSQLFAFSFVMTLQYIRNEHFVYWTAVVIWKN